MFKNLRISIFNWLGAGKITLTTDTPKEYTPNTYTIGGGLSNNPSHGYNFNNNIAPQLQVHNMNLIPSINFNVAKANGGWIVQVNQPQNPNTMSLTGLNLSTADVKQPELYLIAEDADFDKELGKIISLACLKG